MPVFQSFAWVQFPSSFYGLVYFGLVYFWISWDWFSCFQSRPAVPVQVCGLLFFPAGVFVRFHTKHKYYPLNMDSNRILKQRATSTDR